MKKPAIDRRKFLRFAAKTLATAVLPRNLLKADSNTKKTEKPNFIVIFCDDLGYGDIGCFGSKKHNTPNIDQMAQQGIRFTSFYVTSGVCTPSRSSLMTGCYPRRINMHQSARGEWVLLRSAQRFVVCVSRLSGQHRAAERQGDAVLGVRRHDQS